MNILDMEENFEVLRSASSHFRSRAELARNNHPSMNIDSESTKTSEQSKELFK